MVKMTTYPFRDVLLLQTSHNFLSKARRKKHQAREKPGGSFLKFPNVSDLVAKIVCLFRMDPASFKGAPVGIYQATYIPHPTPNMFH